MGSTFYVGMVLIGVFFFVAFFAGRKRQNKDFIDDGSIDLD